MILDPCPACSGKANAGSKALLDEICGQDSHALHCAFNGEWRAGGLSSDEWIILCPLILSIAMNERLIHKKSHLWY